MEWSITAGMPLVTVALPIRHADASLESAFRCITSQTHRDLEILLVLNGSDAGTVALARRLAATDARARVIERPEANLAGALNEALRVAKGALLARMDADDECAPDRIARQVEFLAGEQGVAAVGCAYDVVGQDGRRVFTVRPPTDPKEARWKLLLGNMFAHGSMTMRVREVLGVGGYDERCLRAQDFDLWLRLSRSHGMAALPQVLYTHVVRHHLDATRSTKDQAEVVSQALLERWRSLGNAQNRASLEHAMAQAMTQGENPSVAAQAIETILRDEGPRQDGLLALLWAKSLAPSAPARAAEVSRRARVREVASEIRSKGATSLWLWGAGDHTRKLLDHTEDLGVPVRGIIDDVATGERFGLAIVRPEHVQKDDAVLLSSDWHEDAMWESSAALRQRGVRVFRLYG